MCLTMAHLLKREGMDALRVKGRFVPGNRGAIKRTRVRASPREVERRTSKVPAPTFEVQAFHSKLLASPFEVPPSPFEVPAGTFEVLASPRGVWMRTVYGTQRSGRLK